MHLDDLDYDLPEHLIAQEPVSPRDRSRLLVLRRRCPGTLEHRIFHDRPGLLTPGDLLILNDTRVVAARLVGHRQKTGGKWEGLFVRQHPSPGPCCWELLLQTRGTLTAGETLVVESHEQHHQGGLTLRLLEKIPPGRWLAEPHQDDTPITEPAAAVLARHGQVPIPPYIRKGRADPGDSERYQTLHARRDGAVAAPTAGLHFTEEVNAALAERGIARAFVTLHVGPGTFQPIKVDDLSQHRVEAEWGELPAATAEAIAGCKARGGRVVAVGTTSVRVLESAQGVAWMGATDLTICPPFEFRVVDALLTNFHLPRSSLLLLVSAFAGVEPVRAAYREAVRRGYRFYSYGDAMLIL